jgi:hypothetical protein
MGNSDSSAARQQQLQQQQQYQQPPSQNTAVQNNVTAVPNNGQNPAGAGAYRMPGQPRSGQRFYVTIPRNVRPGQHFAVLVNNQQMMVRCPENSRPGERLIVTPPRSQAQQYVVTVPANVRPNQQFRVMINNQEVMVTCPPGVRPGQRVTFQLPQVQERPPQPAPNHQMFEVTVPEGVRPGQPFALIANGQRVMVTCPPNVRPGQKIRFQLPIQLNQQQLEAIRVNYDKDGWMRCLGQDLKFHWAYNKTEDKSNSGNSTKIRFDHDNHAFVRQFTHEGLVFIPASDYAIDTTVKGTNIAYSELARVATLPFQQKVDWLKTQFNAVRIPWEEGHIKLKVRRSNVLQDSMDAIESIEVNDLRKIFRFEFLGEPALDAGGVAREFFEIVCEQLFDPNFGLFSYSAVNQMCMQINPNSGIANEQHLRFFHVAGRVLGKALMDGQITPVHLVQPLYKHIMGWPITFHDLEYLDDQIYRNLDELLDMDDVSQLFLDFVVTEDKLGVAESVELIPNGTNISVTNENLPQYLEAQFQYRTLTRVQEQLAAFLEGFYDVVPEPLLSVLDFQELELLLHGLPTIDMNDWIQNTEYTGEFLNQPKHKVVQWFWETVEGFEQEQKAKLLQFVTGTSGVPIQGFAYLQGNDGSIRHFTIHGDKNVKVFPRAHTCFNRIDMPIYKSKQELQKYLTMAVSMESSGFGIE